MTNTEAANLNDRQVIIRANDFFPKDQPAKIRLVSEFKRKLLLEFESPITISEVNYKYAIAAPRLAGEHPTTLLHKGILGCGITWVSEKQFNTEDPLDLSWWRGGAAAITDIVLK